MASESKTTIKGSCHCGHIKYSCDIKIDTSGRFSATRCNCTFCQKLGVTNYSPDGPSDFKLLSPKSTDELGDYAPNVKTAHKYFCKDCGVHVWAEGSYEFEGQKHDFFTVNLATVDQPQDSIDLSNATMGYWDGLHDNWHGGSKDKPWPNGLL